MKLWVKLSYKNENYTEKALVDTGNLIYSGVAISDKMAHLGLEFPFYQNRL